MWIISLVCTSLCLPRRNQKVMWALLITAMAKLASVWTRDFVKVAGLCLPWLRKEGISSCHALALLLKPTRAGTPAILWDTRARAEQALMAQSFCLQTWKHYRLRHFSCLKAEEENSPYSVKLTQVKWEVPTLGETIVLTRGWMSVEQCLETAWAIHAAALCTTT